MFVICILVSIGIGFFTGINQEQSTIDKLKAPDRPIHYQASNTPIKGSVK